MDLERTLRLFHTRTWQTIPNLLWGGKKNRRKGGSDPAQICIVPLVLRMCKSSQGILPEPHTWMLGSKMRKQNPSAQGESGEWQEAALVPNVNHLVFNEVLKTRQPLSSLNSWTRRSTTPLVRPDELANRLYTWWWSATIMCKSRQQS